MDARDFRRETFSTVGELRMLLDNMLVPILQKHGISRQQLGVLMELDNRPGLTAAQLSDALHIKRPNLTPVMRRLMSMGLVERRRSKHDRRSHPFVLSLEGKQLMSEVDGEISEIFFGLMASMPRDVFEAVISGIYAIRLFIRGMAGQEGYLLPESVQEQGSGAAGADRPCEPFLLPCSAEAGKQA